MVRTENKRKSNNNNNKKTKVLPRDLVGRSHKCLLFIEGIQGSSKYIPVVLPFNTGRSRTQAARLSPPLFEGQF